MDYKIGEKSKRAIEMNKVEIQKMFETIDRIEFMVDCKDSKGKLLLPHELFEEDRELRRPGYTASIFIGYKKDGVFMYYEKANIHNSEEKKIMVLLDKEEVVYLENIMNEYIKNNYQYDTIGEYFDR